MGIIGRSVPSNFELSVVGNSEVIEENSMEEAIVVSDITLEAAIEVGVQQFRFSGELANVRTVDWNGAEGAESVWTPTTNVNYGASGQ